MKSTRFGTAVLLLTAVMGPWVVHAAGAAAQGGFGAPNQAPVAFFEYEPSPVPVGAAVGFDAVESYDPDGSIVKYEWDFTGDGAVDALGMTAVWVYPEPGTYPVTLRVEDNQGAVATLTRRVTVRPLGLGVIPLEARFTYSPDAPLPGQPVVFDAGDSVVDAFPVTYQWDFNDDGRFDAVGPRVTHRFPYAGPHRVTLQVADGAGRVARLIRVVHVGQRHAALTVESDPDNLTVYIDGVERGRTPLTIELDPGVVHVRVRHFWLGEWEANVDLTHTRSMRVFIELR